MVPYRVFWQALGLFLAEYLFVPFEFVWDSFDFLLLELFWKECDSSDEVAVFWSGWSWYVFSSGGKDGFFCIWCSEDDRELCVVDPTSFPINSWLGGCKPRVSQDRLMFSEFC